jgi:predicted NBD/HSP70 family sugar kinase
MLLGHDGLAGELGHVTVEPQGAVCRCGNRGCLETVASPTAIADLLSRGRGEAVSGADLAGLLGAGDRGALRAIEDAGEAVGRALAMTVMLLNPELIVVGGDLVSAVLTKADLVSADVDRADVDRADVDRASLARAGDALFEPMRRAIGRNTMTSQHRTLKIVPGALGDSAGVLGAAALVLETVPERLGLTVKESEEPGSAGQVPTLKTIR